MHGIGYCLLQCLRLRHSAGNMGENAIIIRRGINNDADAPGQSASITPNVLPLKLALSVTGRGKWLSVGWGLQRVSLYVENIEANASKNKKGTSQSA